MKVLVLGSTGLLGQAVMAEGRSRGFDIVGAARHIGPDAECAIDVTNGDALVACLKDFGPNLIVNCVALVDVAACERDPGLAYSINAAPVLQLANWCEDRDAKLVQISTDHFFTDDASIPSTNDEQADVALLNHYAATKYAGEQFALLNDAALVVRTSIMGIRGWEQPSFAEWAIDAVSNDREMTLFADAFTSSIDTGAMAKSLFDLVAVDASGLLNVAASEVYSKAQFIRALAEGLNVEINNAVEGSAASLTPPRPRNLGLDVGRAHRLLNYQLPDLDAVVAAILRQHREVEAETNRQRSTD